jgi:hypothetical protein
MLKLLCFQGQILAGWRLEIQMIQAILIVLHITLGTDRTDKRAPPFLLVFVSEETCLFIVP